MRSNRPSRAVESGDSGGNETILLCDDEELVRRAVGQVLKNHGYNVLSADGPQQALKVASEHVGTLSLLLTDVVMPQMSGIDLADTIRESNSDLKVLYMSGYSAEGLAPHDVLGHSSELIEKPFLNQDLLQRVRALLDTPQAATHESQNPDR